ncbi:MAG: hypothetical protein AB1489_38315 [Acidobacteriota bacterium]
MEINYFEGEITGRGCGMALQFSYHPAMVDEVKSAINKQRSNYQMRTGNSLQGAGGWVATEKVWFVAQEIWPDVYAELLSKGYLLTPISSSIAVHKSRPRHMTPAPRRTKSASKRNKQVRPFFPIFPIGFVTLGGALLTLGIILVFTASVLNAILIILSGLLITIIPISLFIRRQACYRESLFVALEIQLLTIMAEKQITVTQAALELRQSTDQVKGVLDTLVSKGYIETALDLNSGMVIYQIPKIEFECSQSRSVA